MSSSYFGPTPGGGGGAVTVTNFPSPQLVDIDQATDGTTNAVHLKAGTAIAGKFGIDQTTPGTTNKVAIDQTTPGTTNAVSVVNPSGFPSSVRVQGLSGALGDTTSWDGNLSTPFSAITQMSAGSIANAAVEAIAAGSETDTLSQVSLCSEFLSVTVNNPTGVDCTLTLGNSGATTITVQANSSLNLDGHWSKLVLHATANLQHIIGLYYNPAIT